jgi:hypothetical protein
MICLTDCIEYLHLTEAEVNAIAEHEHVPPIIATELAAYLVENERGERMILDDIAHAARNDDSAEIDKLNQVLKHLIATHPDLR